MKMLGNRNDGWPTVLHAAHGRGQPVWSTCRHLWTLIILGSNVSKRLSNCQKCGRWNARSFVDSRWMCFKLFRHQRLRFRHKLQWFRYRWRRVLFGPSTMLSLGGRQLHIVRHPWHLVKRGTTNRVHKAKFPRGVQNANWSNQTHLVATDINWFNFSTVQFGSKCCDLILCNALRSWDLNFARVSVKSSNVWTSRQISNLCCSISHVISKIVSVTFREFSRKHELCQHAKGRIRSCRIAIRKRKTCWELLKLKGSDQIKNENNFQRKSKLKALKA